MSTESTARTPLPYRLVRPWVSTIVVFSMGTTVGFALRHVVSREIDFSGHPCGRRIDQVWRASTRTGQTKPEAPEYRVASCSLVALEQKRGSRIGYRLP